MLDTQLMPVGTTSGPRHEENAPTGSRPQCSQPLLYSQLIHPTKTRQVTAAPGMSPGMLEGSGPAPATGPAPQRTLTPR